MFYLWAWALAFARVDAPRSQSVQKMHMVTNAALQRKMCAGRVNYMLNHCVFSSEKRSIDFRELDRGVAPPPDIGNEMAEMIGFRESVE